MFVVTHGSAAGDAGELRRFLAERFPSWWLPDHFEFVDALPKTSVGKLDKKELRRRIAAGEVRPQTSGPRAEPGEAPSATTDVSRAS